MSDRETPEAPRFTDVVTRTGVVAWSVVGILVLLGAAVWISAQMRILLAPLVLATVLIYILNPVVTFLKMKGLPRFVGTFLAFVGLIGGLVLAGFLVFPSIGSQASDLGADLPTLYEDTASQLEQLADSVGITVDVWSYDEVEDFVNDPDNQDQFLSAAWERIGAVTSGLLEAILVFFVAPVIAFYMLLDLPRVREEAVALIPARHRDEVRYVGRQLSTAVGGFLRGQVVVAFIVGVMMSVGFWIIGLDFWLLLGMISGFLNIIPFVGPWVGGFLGISVGLVTDSVTMAIWAGVVALVVQQIDNNFISPAVLRVTVRLHAAVIILVLILGGAIGGIWGVLLAVPATAAFKIIAGHLWRTRVLGQSWEEASEALIGEPRSPEPLRSILRRGDTASDDETAEMESPVPTQGDGTQGRGNGGEGDRGGAPEPDDGGAA